MESTNQHPEDRAPMVDHPIANAKASAIHSPPSDWTPGAFEHERLDAFHVAKEALTRGDRIAKRLPRGYSKLADQLRRALLSAYLGVAEAAAREGQDRRARFRCARGEASEAAAALDAVGVLHVGSADEVREVMILLARLAAMLTRLAKLPR